MGRPTTRLAQAFSLLRQETAFLVVTGFTLLLAIAVTRLFFSDYLTYRGMTKHNIITLLQQEDLPYRSEPNPPILAAVQTIAPPAREPKCDSLDPDESMTCRELNSLHDSFNALTEIIAARTPPEGLARRVAEKMYAATSHDCRGDAGDWTDKIIPSLEAFLQAEPGAHRPIVRCGPREGRIREGRLSHELLYGDAGCDPPGATAYSKLLVSPRMNGCAAERSPELVLQEARAPTADTDGLNHCYRERLLRSNDFSYLIELLLRVHERVFRTRDLRWNKYQLVQGFFVSPDSFLRYFDLHGIEPWDALSKARLWGANTFVQVPLDNQKEFLDPMKLGGSASRSPARIAADLCASIPVRRYVDYGGYGLVQTRCSCAVDWLGSLVGVFCTDYTVPPVAGGYEKTQAEDPGHAENTSVRFWLARLLHYWSKYRPAESAVLDNGLFTWRLARVAAGVASEDACVRSLILGGRDSLTVRSDDASVQGVEVPFANAPEVVARQICSRVVARPVEFFQGVERFSSNETGSPGFFFVPIGREGPSKSADHIGLILQPLPQHPPVSSLVFMILAWFTVALMVVYRSYLERSLGSRLRDDLILRNLQAGVIDVSEGEGQIIEYANDRAEEVFDGRLRAFGAEEDLTGPRRLLDFVEEVFLRWPRESKEPTTPLNMETIAKGLLPITLEEIGNMRKRGDISDYYALRKRPRVDGKVTNKDVWIRIKGGPVFEESTREGEGPRTFAVVQVVSSPMIRLVLKDRANALRKGDRPA